MPSKQGAFVAFEPVTGDHAIIEVVFGLTLSRPFSPNEIEKLAKSHDQWRADLPRLSRVGSAPFLIGEFPPPQGFQFTMGSGVSFERIKPDGTLDWRILVENNNLYINCLSYTRWAEIWPRAYQYLREVLEASEAGDNLITGNTLQYIDLFKWTRSIEDYDAKEILKPGDHVPAYVFNKGHLWHLYQGWFEPHENGRILERAQIDAVTDENNIPILKIDAYMQHQLATFYTASEAINNEWLQQSFESMHTKNKQLLRSFLTDEMAERINLNVA